MNTEDKTKRGRIKNETIRMGLGIISPKEMTTEIVW